MVTIGHRFASHVLPQNHPGFGVRLRSGKASYVVQYRIGAEQRRKSLGDIRKVTVEDARGIARKRFAQVELGIDPDAEEAKRKADQEADGRTFEKMVELYLAAQKARLDAGTLRRNTYIAEERYLRRHCGSLQKKPVSKIAFEEIAALIRGLIKAHGATSAARARGALCHSSGGACVTVVGGRLSSYRAARSSRRCLVKGSFEIAAKS